VKAYVLIKIRGCEIPDALRQLREAQGVASVDVTFGPYDAIALVEANDLGTLGRVVSRNIQPCVGVEDTLACLTVEGA
jgi:hypothetical protein